MTTTTTTTTTETHTNADVWRVDIETHDGNQRAGLASPTYARRPRAVLRCKNTNRPDTVLILASHGILYDDAGRVGLYVTRTASGCLSLSTRTGLSAWRFVDASNGRRVFALARDAWCALTADQRRAVADAHNGEREGGVSPVALLAVLDVVAAVARELDPGILPEIERKHTRLTLTGTTVPAFEYGAAYCPSCRHIDEDAGIEPDARARCYNCGAEAMGLEDAVIAGHLAARYA